MVERQYVPVPFTMPSRCSGVDQLASDKRMLNPVGVRESAAQSLGGALREESQ